MYITPDQHTSSWPSLSFKNKNMLDDFFYPNDNVKVWSGNFILLAFSGFLTFAMVYGLLTANTMNLTADEDYTFGQAAL